MAAEAFFPLDSFAHDPSGTLQHLSPLPASAVPLQLNTAQGAADYTDGPSDALQPHDWRSLQQHDEDAAFAQQLAREEEARLQVAFGALVYVARCIGLRCTLHGLRCTAHVVSCKVYYCLLHVAPGMLHGPCCMSHAACRTLDVASWAVGEARPQEEKDAQLARELSDEYQREEHADAAFARQLQARAPRRGYRVPLSTA